MRMIIEQPRLPTIASVLEAMGTRSAEFDWYIAKFEGYPWPVEFNNCWLAGVELENLLAANPSISWAVLSAFCIGERPLLASTPFADGHSELWSTGSSSTQLTGALFELVVWDSSALILTGLSAEQVDRLRQAFPCTPIPAPTPRA